MKTTLFCALLALLAAAPATVHAVELRYSVTFRDYVMATQTVDVVQTDSRKTVTASFESDLPVFIALHHYSERLSATFRDDGTVERLEAVRTDGPLRTEISGTPAADGSLRIVRTDRNGISTNLLAREDYDFCDLAIYGTAPADFLPTNAPARVLSVAEGAVLPVAIRRIDESDTFERQHLTTTHLVWTEGNHVSHSWHPERFSNLPRRYVRQTESGEFTFNLLR